MKPSLKRRVILLCLRTDESLNCLFATLKLERRQLVKVTPFSKIILVGISSELPKLKNKFRWANACSRLAIKSRIMDKGVFHCFYFFVITLKSLCTHWSDSERLEKDHHKASSKVLKTYFFLKNSCFNAQPHLKNITLISKFVVSTNIWYSDFLSCKIQWHLIHYYLYLSNLIMLTIYGITSIFFVRLNSV